MIPPRSPLLGALPQYVVGAVRADQHGPTRLDDPPLLPRDLRDSLPQYARVLQSDRSDDAQFRTRDDVGRVEPTSQPRLQDDRVASALLEVQKGQGGRHLEVRGGDVAGFARLEDAGEEILHLGFGDGDAVDGHALTEGGDVGTGEQTDAIGAGAVSGELERSCGFEGDRALAIGSGDVNDRDGGVVQRTFQRPMQILNVLQSHLDGMEQVGHVQSPYEPLVQGFVRRRHDFGDAGRLVGRKGNRRGGGGGGGAGESLASFVRDDDAAERARGGGGRRGRRRRRIGPHRRRRPMIPPRGGRRREEEDRRRSRPGSTPGSRGRSTEGGGKNERDSSPSGGGGVHSGAGSGGGEEGEGEGERRERKQQQSHRRKSPSCAWWRWGRPAVSPAAMTADLQRRLRSHVVRPGVFGR
mmetsp:Transcript_20624/g.59886  ORF Transcript_20624/g.59886 Transcript_20624/m.59886 type:complete len:411 (+) Transcript_20624:1061-2293(+)